MDEESRWSQGGANCVASGGGKGGARGKMGVRQGRNMGPLLQQIQVLLYVVDVFQSYLRISGKRYTVVLNCIIGVLGHVALLNQV